MVNRSRGATGTGGDKTGRGARMEVGRCYHNDKQRTNARRFLAVRGTDGRGGYLVQREGRFETEWVIDASGWSRIDCGTGTNLPPELRVAFDDFCEIGSSVKVWWEDDAYFYPGVVVAQTVAKIGELERKRVRVRYFDSFEEWVDCDSGGLFPVVRRIQPRLPGAYAASGDRNVHQRHETGAVGWRIGVAEPSSRVGGLEVGDHAAEYQYGFVTAAAPDGGLDARLDDGTERTISSAASVVWLWPPRENLDLSLRVNESGGAVTWRAIVWLREDGFEPAACEVTLASPVWDLSGRFVWARAKIEGRGEVRIDLAGSMVKWCGGSGFDGRHGAFEGSGGSQYDLHGEEHALVPFLGHSLGLPPGEGQLSVLLHRLVGMRVIITRLVSPGIRGTGGGGEYSIRFAFVASPERVVYDDGTGTSEKPPEVCRPASLLRDNSAYVDCLGRAGDLERTSSCLPQMLPVSCLGCQGLFLPSRGLILHEGRGFGPADFVGLAAERAGESRKSRSSLRAAWRDEIEVKTGSAKKGGESELGRVTIGRWLASYSVDVERSPYWPLVSDEAMENTSLAVSVSADVAAQSRGVRRPPLRQAADPIDGARVLREMLGRGVRGNRVLGPLLDDWVRENAREFALGVGQGKGFRKDQLEALEGHIKDVVRSARYLDKAQSNPERDPMFYTSCRLHNQAFEALCHLKEFLLLCDLQDRGGARVEAFKTFPETFRQTFPPDSALSSLLCLLSLVEAKAQCGLPLRNEQSAFEFHREGSLFQFFWSWSRGRLEDLAHPGTMNNGPPPEILTYDKVQGKRAKKFGSFKNAITLTKAKVGLKLAKRRRKSNTALILPGTPIPKQYLAEDDLTERAQQEDPNEGKSPAGSKKYKKVQRKFKHSRIPKDEDVRSKPVEAFAESREYVLGQIRSSLADRPVDLQRMERYMESQRHNYGIIPSRSPEQTDEFNSLMKYCRELLTRGASAKSTSLNWILKFFSQGHLVPGLNAGYKELEGLCTMELMEKFYKWLIWDHQQEKNEKPPQSFYKYKVGHPSSSRITDMLLTHLTPSPSRPTFHTFGPTFGVGPRESASPRSASSTKASRKRSTT